MTNIPHNNEATFNICKHSMKQLYEMGAEKMAKRELWDMCIIAEGGTPSRKWGGAKVEIETDEGKPVFTAKKKLSPEILKSVDCEITIGG